MRCLLLLQPDHFSRYPIIKRLLTFKFLFRFYETSKICTTYDNINMHLIKLFSYSPIKNRNLSSNNIAFPITLKFSKIQLFSILHL